MNAEQFERELRTALQRETAPPDFAARVTAQLPRRNRFGSWAIAAAVSAALIVPAALYEQRRERELKAERAKQQLVTALNITRAQIIRTRELIHRRTRRL